MNSHENGRRKAAVLLLSLPEELAAVLLSKLDWQQIESVAAEIAGIHSVTFVEHQQILEQFLQADAVNADTVSGGLETMMRLVGRLPGRSARDVIDRLRREIDKRPFGFLHGMEPATLVQLLKDEHPQCLALILFHLSPTCAAQVISHLPTKQQIEVVRRIAEMGPCDQDSLAALEASLQERISRAVEQSRQADGIFRVAEILSLIDRSSVSALREHLRVEAPEFAEEVFRLTVNFEEVHQLADDELRVLLRTVTIPTWATAISGCSDQLRARIVDRLTEEDIRALEEESPRVETASPSQVEAAQADIVRAIYRLRHTGRILWSPQSNHSRHFQTDQRKAA